MAAAAYVSIDIEMRGLYSIGVRLGEGESNNTRSRLGRPYFPRPLAPVNRRSRQDGQVGQIPGELASSPISGRYESDSHERRCAMDNTTCEHWSVSTSVQVLVAGRILMEQEMTTHLKQRSFAAK
jgi:hypothetical protein